MVLIYSLVDVFYYSFYIQGFYEIFGKRNVHFSLKGFPDFPERTFAAIVIENGKEYRIIIDAFDSSRIYREQLKWCNTYGKVNYNDKDIDRNGKEKIVIIGPSFGIKIWSLPKTIKTAIINFIWSKNKIYFKRNFLANYWRQYNRRPLSEYYKVKSKSNYIFFLSSIWEREKETNENRSNFIRAAKTIENINFEGGFAPRPDGKNFNYESLIYRRIKLQEYLMKIKMSVLVFNTPAVQNCHGWKLAEYLALGKAIISTEIINELPAELKHQLNIHYVSNKKSEIKKDLLLIISDEDYRISLEENARKYFEENLSPKRVIEKLIKI